MGFDRDNPHKWFTAGEAAPWAYVRNDEGEV